MDRETRYKNWKMTTVTVPLPKTPRELETELMEARRQMLAQWDAWICRQMFGTPEKSE